MRETRFYRRVNGKWLRTVPQEKFWGVERKFPTDTVDFVYRSLDEPEVAEVISRIDPYLNQLQTDFGVLFPKGDNKLVIEVLPDTGVFLQGVAFPQGGGFSQDGGFPQGGAPPQTGSLGFRFSGNHLIVPSPRLVRTPEDVSLGAQLMYTLAQPLASYLLSQRPGTRQTSIQWRTVTSAMVAWEALAVTYANANLNTQGLDLLKTSLASNDLIPLDEMTLQGNTDRTRRPLAQAEAQELIDYIVKKYGREELSHMLNELPHVGNLPQLIPKVLGVDVGQFERDWLQFMLTKYDIKVTLPSNPPGRTATSHFPAPLDDQIPTTIKPARPLL